MLGLAADPASTQSLFWEAPQPLATAPARFLASGSAGGTAAATWQEFVDGESGREVFVSVAWRPDDGGWQQTRRLLGPFAASEQEASIHSLLVTRAGEVVVAVLTGEQEVRVYGVEPSTADSLVATQLAVVLTIAPIVSPQIFATSDGQLILYVTEERGDFQTIFFTVSDSGREWPRERLLVTEPQLPLTFLPHHVVHGGADYVAFQSQTVGEETQRQEVFLKRSGDGARTWGAALSLAFAEAVNGRERAATDFGNERPTLASLETGLSIVWERQFLNNPAQVYFGLLDEIGSFQTAPEAVNDPGAAAHFPAAFQLRDSTYVLFFDNRRGSDQLVLAENRRGRWDNRVVTSEPGGARFGFPLVAASAAAGSTPPIAASSEGAATLDIELVFELGESPATRLSSIVPDREVAPPAVAARNFLADAASNISRPEFRWVAPEDPSDIAGFGFSWGRLADPVVEREIKLLFDDDRLALDAPDDGDWFFRLAVTDRAGNWAQSDTVRFVRDTVPPQEVAFLPMEVDEASFLASNTFRVGWTPRDDDVAGYAYRFAPLSPDPAAEAVAASVPAPPDRVVGAAPEIGFSNVDNGLWAVSVKAQDRAGNFGPAASLVLRLNKYIPVTYITAVGSKTDDLGNTILTINGRGFAAGGRVAEVLIDRDGLAPYDYRLAAADGAFQVGSDLLIQEVQIGDIEAGDYRIGLVHPTRGINFARPLLTFEPQGTVKFGDFRVADGRFGTAQLVSALLRADRAVVWLVVALLGLMALFATRRLGLAVIEGRALQRDVHALVAERMPRGQLAGPAHRLEKMKQLQRKGLGLRIKYTLLMIVLVILIVLVVAIPLGVSMINTQRDTLATGLRDRAEVQLGSLAQGAATFLANGDRLQLLSLPSQVAAMEEALFATVTGPFDWDLELPEDGAGIEYVWASNDGDLEAKIGGEEFRSGRFRIADEISPLVAALAASIDTQAEETVGERARQLDEMRVELLTIVTSLRDEDMQRTELLSTARSELNLAIDTELARIANRVASVPAFATEDILPSYTFYRPIVYREPGVDRYVRGVVRLGVSTARMLADIDAAVQQLISRTGLVALVAMLLGVLGAFILASITITPIKKLARGVAVIRDTEDKEQLGEQLVAVSTKDEIGQLAETINEMAQALVVAAKASKDLTVGAAIQKQFIPLDAASDGGKGNTGGERNQNLELFGFFEGAKTVSGDYFEYKRLDTKHVAIIKCDIAGKGVPAALIMVQVATIFHGFFRNWTLQSPGMHVDTLCYEINDMLEERGFKGRFAALTVGILDEQTGRGVMCNAGDNLLHVYRRAAGRTVEETMPEAPAAGVFPSMLVEMQSGFKQVPWIINPGDVVMLFTDGLEEAQRKFRDEGFRLMQHDPEQPDRSIRNPDLVQALEVGAEFEELGNPRIHAIIDAIMGQREFELERYHNPLQGEVLTFDFTSCGNTAEDVVAGLIAVEKVFRLLPDPSAGEEDVVRVHGWVDTFLQKHFRQYSLYFGHLLPAEAGSDHVRFSHLREDEQYDDLTVLAVRKTLANEAQPAAPNNGAAAGAGSTPAAPGDLAPASSPAAVSPA
jgi:serine phosphatase RsbU (regulator of sigma subunit)